MTGELTRGNPRKREKQAKVSPMDRKPPLAVSPRRLRPRRPPPRSTPSVQTPPATFKSARYSSMKSPIQPVYQMISLELMALAERAKEEFGSNDDLGSTFSSSITCSSSPMFERGRFYELYSARRNEKLKRKKEEIEEDMIAQDPGIAIELAKRRSSKKVDSMRKSVPADFSSSRVLRSSVRSSKEMRKPSALTSPDKPAATGKRIGTRSMRKL
ncbi:uncharacterized protein [Elaeis guineensis]|uniref:Uncharacterized protein LOC105042642 n=1 Tax=Elaeis guineensis var. tenera TaxID=51953 RepID=A0A6I9R016_ELAGV|nr:uncharacterized protein LOC105042642 [Elaeis guineensis]